MPTSFNIVIVEDDRILRETTAALLETNGFKVVALECAEDLEEFVGSKRVDLFLLDLNLPGEDGISLAHRLRMTHPEVGIIMITAKSKPVDLTLGYTKGADMYLVKPLASETLLAAVNSIRRRFLQNAQNRGLKLDKLSLLLQGAAGSIELQSIEADILIAFARAPEQRLETWQLSEILGDEVTVSKSGIEVRLTRLRKKLQAVGASKQCIKSIRTVGYQFCDTLLIY